MQRRTFMSGTAGAVAAAGAGLSARTAWAKPEYKWKMVTTWPKNFPG